MKKSDQMPSTITAPAWKFISHVAVEKETRWLWVRKIQEGKKQINDTNISD